MPDVSDLPAPLPPEALPQRLLWRGDGLPADAGRISLPAMVEQEFDRIVDKLDRNHQR